MAVDPPTAALVVALARALLARQADGEGLTPEGLTPGLDAALREIERAPTLVLQAVTVGSAPVRLLEARPNRRRVVIQNAGTVELQVATRSTDLPNAGLRLAAGAVLIDEDPYAHRGEWWATAGGTVTVVVGEVA